MVQTHIIYAFPNILLAFWERLCLRRIEQLDSGEYIDSNVLLRIFFVLRIFYAVKLKKIMETYVVVNIFKAIEWLHITESEKYLYTNNK